VEFNTIVAGKMKEFEKLVLSPKIATQARKMNWEK